MKLPLYQVDAFTDKLFSGNPAAIVPLDNWISESLMQNIAAENNLAETAFYVKAKNNYEIRWFTPMVEVDLCGHATLAAAHVIFNYENYNNDTISFHSHRSGLLKVKKGKNHLTLDFPIDTFEKVEIPKELKNGFNKPALEAYKGKTDYLLVFSSQKEIEDIVPDLNLISKVKARGVIVSAKGDQVDFVSRFFAPQSGIDEDPVTGSAHTTLTPYWSKKLQKKDLSALQLSKRIGKLQCKLSGERIEISGQARTYMIGEISIE